MATSTNINLNPWENVADETQNKSPYSQEQLPCNGRACAKCGKCRDWYWTIVTSCLSYRKAYMKRADATCTGCYGGAYDSRYDCDCCFGGGSYYHYFFSYCCFGRHCECDDNRFDF
jgi:hypothetical protein